VSSSTSSNLSLGVRKKAAVATAVGGGHMSSASSAGHSHVPSPSVRMCDPINSEILSNSHSHDARNNSGGHCSPLKSNRLLQSSLRSTTITASASAGGSASTGANNANSSTTPCPLQTVTVAVPSNDNDTGQKHGLSQHRPLHSQAEVRRTSASVPPSLPSARGLAGAGITPSLGRRGGRSSSRRRSRHRHKHLPQGLPVFKDSRSCMWTSTHDANAPSEDRYSSLVNVLLRPPKTSANSSSGAVSVGVGTSCRGEDMSKTSNGGGGNPQNTNNTNNNNQNYHNNPNDPNNCNNTVISNTASINPINQNNPDNQSNMGKSSYNANNDNTNTTSSNNSQRNVSAIGEHADETASASGSSDGSSYSDEETASDPSIAATQATQEGRESASHQGPNNHSNSQDDDEDNTSLIRLSLWSVIDGHGGGCVATYAAEVLLPHIAASVARALKSEIVDRGVCNVNGQLRDANALDLDGLIRSSDRSRNNGGNKSREAGIDVVNPNSIHYRSPYEDSESEGDVGVDHSASVVGSEHDSILRSESESEAESEAPVSVASSLLPRNPFPPAESVSSVKTSVKTAVSPVTQHAPVGTHSPAEVAAITRAITDSFLAVDEGWINSIDPVTTHQTSCVSNGRWNAGACALVVFIVQRLDWCRSSRADHETHHRDRGARGFEDTSHNKDAARRRKLDYATKSKSVSSLSTLSSTSSITTEANTTEMLVEESEITETEDDDDVSDIFGPRRRRRKTAGHIDDPHHHEGVFIATPAGCKCHYYRPHDAMLYTAHVGDCRAVMLGSAPPRTIKVPPEGDSLHHAADTSEDEYSSESIADEISSSDHDSDSSEGEEDDEHFMKRGTPPAGKAGNAAYMGYVRRASSKRQRRNEKNVTDQPFVPLPPLSRRESSSSEESAVESDDSTSTTAQVPQPPVIRTRVRGQMRPFNNIEEENMETEEDEIPDARSVRSASPTQMDRPPSPTQLVADPPVHPPPLPLSMLMRPIDLTTDHSAYNPAEVTAVLRRCNNAPKAISSASGGGIKRVAGSLAVTRALGDAYLKTPRLSFFPYKRHAPYITARPEVNCRVLTKGADRILILASDGVWERASGDDVLRWVRNYYNARIAGVKEQYPYGTSGVEDHPYGEIIKKRISRRKHSRHGGGSASVSAASAPASTSNNLGGETDIIAKEAKKTANVDPPVSGLPIKEPIAEVAPDTNEAESDSAMTAEAATADATVKSGTKRKHCNPTGSISTRSSNGSSRGHSRRNRSPRSHSLAIPTVSEVIVRKVLNKVRKTRNISSLRMLMSLPKGRARRSKHDDITASVVDLSGFVS